MTVFCRFQKKPAFTHGIILSVNLGFILFSSGIRPMPLTDAKRRHEMIIANGVWDDHAE